MRRTAGYYVATIVPSSYPLLSRFLRHLSAIGTNRWITSTGLSLSEQVYEQLIAGKCDRWYHQKESFVKHLSSKMHINATEFMKSVNEGKSREVLVTKNQFRATIGIVKTKSAAIQYEESIAELQVQMLATLDIPESFSRQCYLRRVLTSARKRRFFFQLLFRTQECLRTFILQQTSPPTIESLIK